MMWPDQLINLIVSALSVKTDDGIAAVAAVVITIYFFGALCVAGLFTFIYMFFKGEL